MVTKNRWQYILAAVTFLLVVLPFSGGASPAKAADSRTFPETGHTVKGIFLTYWNNHGQLAQQGYPISEEMQEQSDTDGNTYTVQYFQRAVFERHPEFAGTPSEVLLSLLGVSYYNDKYLVNAPNQTVSTSNPRKFPETGKTIGGAFRKYWEAHGGLAQQGYPISEEFQEVSDTDGNTYTVQYFQRAVFEYHPEFAGTPNEVLLSLLGVSTYYKKYGSGGGGGGGTPVPTATPKPPAQDNSGQVLFYNDATGGAEIGRVDASGNYATLQPAALGGSVGWTNIIALGSGRILWYNRNNGSDVVGQVANDGKYHDVKSASDLGAGWTHIASAGNGLIVYYKATTSTGGTARVNADGSITLLKVYTTFGTGWTHVVGLDNGVLLFYQRGTANAATLKIDNDGNLINLKTYTNWTTIWTNIVPGINGTVLQYYYIDGRAVVSKIGADGVEQVLARYPGTGAGGEPPLPLSFVVVAGMSNGTVLFYNDSDRSALTGRISGDGSVLRYVTYPGGSFGEWSHIVGIR